MVVSRTLLDSVTELDAWRFLTRVVQQVFHNEKISEVS